MQVFQCISSQGSTDKGSGSFSAAADGPVYVTGCGQSRACLCLAYCWNSLDLGRNHTRLGWFAMAVIWCGLDMGCDRSTLLRLVFSQCILCCNHYVRSDHQDA